MDKDNKFQREKNEFTPHILSGKDEIGQVVQDWIIHHGNEGRKGEVSHAIKTY